MFKYGRAGKISIVRDEKDTMNYDIPLNIIGFEE